MSELSAAMLGLNSVGKVYRNLSYDDLFAHETANQEGAVSANGTMMVDTGKFTGRSPADKHIVRTPSVEDTIWWDNNRPMSPEGFDALYADMLDHMKGRDYFVQDLFGGADPAHRLDVRVVTELAWHGLFIRHLLRRPDREELDSFAPDFTIINSPSFQADPERHGCRSETVIALNFDRKMILIGGTEYAGEMKKSIYAGRQMKKQVTRPDDDYSQVYKVATTVSTSPVTQRCMFTPPVASFHCPT